MRLLAAVLSLALSVTPAVAEQIDRLMTALHMDEVIELLRHEGQMQAQEINTTMLDGAGGAYFATQIDMIYDPDWMRDQFSTAFVETLSDSQMERAVLFFESDLGQTVVRLENSARQAFQDETIEEMAQDAYSAQDQDSTFFQLVDEYIEVNELIEKNVKSAVSADYNFFRGLNSEIGGDDGEVLAQLLAEKDAITQETRTWLYSFLLMAYQPLDEAQLRENIAFSRTQTGRAVNEAFFDSFDRTYDKIYYRLGLAVSQVLRGSDL
ncbi:DUF2059 domain-containing protein [Ruegeria lacuscaerulensis]|uniref:DUF2059 domain-containing protein n=1 Tax=Ruegeria lacuscaerulensis TaxID=55218 RepID=UPI00147AE310|nr:DUF2059 domain-containing protein [Ruegeria lacuscaerulensis]